MSELVLLHHNEPMTTSLAFAAGTQNEHDSVILLVRKFIDDLEEFGKVSFETAPDGFSRFEIGETVVEVENKRGKQGARTQFAFLNEPQATLLITYLRNSEIVRRFKIALVKAFYELRDRLAVSPAPTLGSIPAHAADRVVAADRTFRAVMRSGRSAGLRLPAALRRANAVAQRETGIDVLADLLDLPPPQDAPAPPEDPILVALRAWLLDQAGAGPWRLDEIVAQVVGLKPGDADYLRRRRQVATLLEGFGIIRRFVTGPSGKTRRVWGRFG